MGASAIAKYQASSVKSNAPSAKRAGVHSRAVFDQVLGCSGVKPGVHLRRTLEATVMAVACGFAGSAATATGVCR
jgi:hypothetical protein